MNILNKHNILRSEKKSQLKIHVSHYIVLRDKNGDCCHQIGLKSTLLGQKCNKNRMICANVQRGIRQTAAPGNAFIFCYRECR